MNTNMCVIKYHNMTHNNVVRHAWHGIAMELLSFIEYQVIGKYKTLYNVVANDMPLSCTSNAITQGKCVRHGIEELETKKGRLYT